MTDRLLLQKDLLGRLPYDVKVQIEDFDIDVDTIRYIDIEENMIQPNEINDYIDIIYIKSYLRPLSSMTEKERDEIDRLNKPNGGDYIVQLSRDKQELYNNFSKVVDFKYINKIYDWLNERHFDYRGLIEKGLAIEVTEENNPYKN